MNLTVSNRLKSEGGLITPSEFSALQKISAAFSDLIAKLWPSNSQAYQTIEAVSFAIDGLYMGHVSKLYIKVVLKIPGENEKIDLPGNWLGPEGIVIFPSPFNTSLDDVVAPAPTLNGVPLAIVNAIQKTLKQKLALLQNRAIVYSAIITDLVGLVLDEEMTASKSQKSNN